jgi:hypothetical protein
MRKPAANAVAAATTPAGRDNASAVELVCLALLLALAALALRILTIW